MKKITAILLIVLMTVGLCACEKPVEFTGQVADTVQEVSAEETVEEVAEAEQEALFTGLPEDARKIAEFTGIEPGEYEDIRDVDYYADYVDSMYDIPYWKAFGTAAMIYGYEPAKTEEQVVKYLNSRAPRGFDFLFEAFFNKKYAAKDIIECAKSYAYYLTKATLENHSYADFLQNDYREEWYEAVGCTREYNYDEYDKLIENGKSNRKDDNVIELTVGKHMWVYGGETWINSAQELYELIHDSQESFDLMEELVKADAPHFFETYAKGSYAIVELVDDDRWSVTRKTNYGGWIMLAFAHAAPHEYVHALTKRATGPDVKWIAEGIAEYYSCKYKNGKGSMNSYFTDYMRGDVADDYWDGVDPEDRKRGEPILAECKETFNSYKEKYGDEYEDELYAYLAVAEEEIGRGDIYTFSVQNAYNLDGIKKGRRITIEDEISYLGAGVLAKEMLKDFGAEKVLTYLYVGGDFKLNFGMTSAEYLEKVRERGGYKRGFFDDTPYNNE